ncbi:MAG: hypothetical protein IPM42_21915 [Saprospiraceae bacterium]|nr:hypothetical protein [Saprospiraceae bacterium]
MIGLINCKADNAPFVIPVDSGGNVYPVNLKPWDIHIKVNKSKIYPDGKRVVPAATQEEFKLILQSCPELTNKIGELSPDQEKVVRASLSENCEWYKNQNKREQPKESVKDSVSTNSKP